MHPFDERDVELELLVGGPAEAALGLAEVIQQDQELLLGDRLPEPRFLGRFRRRVDLADQDIAEQSNEIAEQSCQILAGLGLTLHDGQCGGRIAGDEGSRKLQDGFTRCESEDVVDIGGADRRAAEGDDLIEHRLGVTHRPVGPARDRGGGSGIECDLLVLGDVQQMVGDEFRRQSPQVEALASAEDGGRHLLRLGRGEEELHVLRGLFQRLEQRVEGRGREHVHLVDEVDLVRSAGRGVGGVLAKRADAVDAVVARPVDLHHVETATLGDLDAGIAGAAGIVGRLALVGETVEGLGQDACRGGLPDAAGTDEEVGLREPLAGDRVLERPGDVFLAHDLLEALGTVFAGEDSVAHGGRKLKAPVEKVEGRRSGSRGGYRLSDSPGEGRAGFASERWPIIS